MIRSFFRRWRPRHLLIAWCAYWLALVAVKLGPAMAAIWRLSRKGEHGSANGSVTDGIISFNIIEAGQPVWAGTISVLHLTLLVALPPLALWVAWLLITSRTNNADEIGLKSRKEMRELHATEHRFGTIDTSSTFPSKRREREES